MALKQIEAHNFKSFRDLSVELGQLNVLIGANASGKSNFVQLLRFLRDIANLGLKDALSLQGGSEYLPNLSLGSSVPFQVKLRVGEASSLHGFEITTGDSSVGIQSNGIAYEFTLTKDHAREGYIASEDRLKIECEFFEKGASNGVVARRLGPGYISFTNLGDKIEYHIETPDGLADKVVISPFWSSLWHLIGEEESTKGLLLENLTMRPLLRQITLMDLLARLPIYDLDAKLPKQVAQLTGKTDLEEDGSNLVIALKNILEDEEKRRLFSNLLRDILPFVSDIDVQRFADRFLHFRLRETYSGGQYLPASLMSDGTVNITALIVALYFSDKPLIVIEEPEKNIHPYLIARVANMLKDASRHKQIIVTTHNPEIVRNVGLDDLLLVSRDREGFSTIRRPAEDRDVQTFLSNEIGIEELFARNLLGA